MATDIRVSELNQITRNKCFNEIIVNDKSSENDLGVTKSIEMRNLLTPDIVQGINILDGAVGPTKIAEKSIDNSKIVDGTITGDQIAVNTIGSREIGFGSCGVCGINLNPSDCYTMSGLTVGSSTASNNCQVRAGVVLATQRLKTCTGRIDVGLSTQYFLPKTQVAGKFLKTDGNGNLSWEAPVEAEATTLVFQDVFPVGTIVPWAANSLPADGKWLECDGSNFDGTTYPELAALLGDTWGQRVGNQYKRPDLRGRVPLGTGVSEPDTNNESCSFGFCTNGDTHLGGAFNHKLTSDELASHGHKINGSFICDIRGGGGGFTCKMAKKGITGIKPNGGGDTATQSSTCGVGKGDGHNNIQPYSVVRYIIKAKPDTLQSLNAELGGGLSATDAAGAQSSQFTLSSTGIGLKITEDFEFDGQNKLKLSQVAPVGTELGTFEAVEACSAGCVLGTVNTNQNYLRAWNKTTGCINFDSGGDSFIAIGNGQAGKYYPNNTTADKTCARICFKKPGIYNICYTGNSVEWNQVAYMVARQGSSCKIGYDIRGNQIHSTQVGNVGDGSDGQDITFERTILVPTAGCAFIYQRVVQGTGRMGYAKYCTSFTGSGGCDTGGSHACSIFASLKITRLNHYNTNMSPATGTMTSFYKDI
tara:strand:+ start:4717 stop:6654 length:1938 start_codon:yes stop_codon:yes gene_type:complete